jgi:hypothetical protein
MPGRCRVLRLTAVVLEVFALVLVPVETVLGAAVRIAEVDLEAVAALIAGAAGAEAGAGAGAEGLPG